MHNENILQRISLILLCTALAVYLISFAATHLAAAFLPFITAWAFALGLKKPSEFLSRRMRIPKKAASVLVFALAVVLLVYIVFLVGSILLREGRELYFRISESGVKAESTVESLSYVLRDTIRKIPYIGKSDAVRELTENFDEKILAFTTESAPKIISFLGSLLSKIARSVPYFAFFLLVTVIAAFYFCIDLDGINRGLASSLPKKQRGILYIIKEELFSVVFGYFRAYSLIIALTFLELLIGLSIIGIEYAFLLSFLIALVDILPVLGAGTVLIPWGTTLLIFGNIRDGTCILVLYLVITVIRQLAEPRIVGGFLGLHPLCTLLAMYTGVRLAGVLGLFLFPVVAIVARNVLRRYREREGNLSS